MINVDAGGLSCPEPVILLKKAMQDHNAIRLSVDNQASAKICGRFAQSRGYNVSAERADGGYILEINKNE